MTTEDTVHSPVPADFPRSCGGALSGTQPKIAVRRIAGEFIAGPTEEEHRARYEACQSMAEALVEYSRRKRTQLAHLSLKDYMRRLREAVVRKGWDLDSAELAWVMQRVTIALGGTATDVPKQEFPDTVPKDMTTATAPVETFGDRAFGQVKGARRDEG